MNRHLQSGLILCAVVTTLSCSDVQAPTEPTDAVSAAMVTHTFTGSELHALAEYIEALEATGVLTKGQANSLLAQLRQVERLSMRDSDASRIADALINHLSSLIEEGVLTPDQAQPLINGVSNVTRPGLEAVSVTLGHFFACALTEAGAVVCWGANDRGQLGNGSFMDSSSPVPVTGGHVFQSIAAASDYVCGLDLDGVALCWGGNRTGALGDGTSIDRAVPGPVIGDLRFSQLSVGAEHACGLTVEGALYCWGGGRPPGAGRDLGLGIPLTEECVGIFGVGPCVTTPSLVANGLEFRQVAVALNGTCGLTTAGAAYCWGWNLLWQLGDGTTDSSMSPVAVGGGILFRTLAAGAVHICGIDQSDAGHCWGARFFVNGELGTGRFEGEALPAPVAGGHRFAELSPSGANTIFGHTCAVTLAGDAYCWGPNDRGQLGTLEATSTCPNVALGDTCTSIPLEVFGSIPFERIHAGGGSTCAVAISGIVYCWGDNLRGQLGTGTNDPAATPVKVIPVQ